MREYTKWYSKRVYTFVFKYNYLIISTSRKIFYKVANYGKTKKEVLSVPRKKLKEAFLNKKVVRPSSVHATSIYVASASKGSRVH